MKIFKRYKITEHIKGGYALEHRKLFSDWKLLLIYTNKTEAIDEIEKHRRIKSEYY